MRRAIQGLFVALMAAEVLVVGQGADVNRILAGVRAALGGDKLDAVKTVTVEGRSTRAGASDTSTSNDFEMAFELPDKFMKRDVVGNFNGMPITRRSGFNGAGLIEETDAPTMMAGGGGGMRIMTMSPGGPTPGGQATPAQIDAQRKLSMAGNRREFARLALGLFGATSAVFPVEFTYGGQAESPDGKADILDVKGPDGFVARFFIDAKTHLPLMLTWMDREPIRMSVGGPGPQAATGGAPGAHVQMAARGGAATPQEVEKMQQELAERMKEADGKRRVVEYRIFYADYKPVNGVQLPTRIQRMVDGFATEELSLEKIKINQKIDPKKFEAIK